MKLATLTLLAAASAFATANCDTAFQTTFRSGAALSLDVRAGDIDVEGIDDDVIRVECRADQSPSEIRVEFDSKSNKLRVEGGPKNHVRIRIEIPRQTNLTLRVSAGDVDVRGIRGHKDISLRAGDLKIDAGDPSEYSSVEASVKAGDLRATAFGVNKGGLFRSFQQSRPGGKYRLKASLWAGDIELR